jgi:hypothetical protein
MSFSRARERFRLLAVGARVHGLEGLFVKERRGLAQAAPLTDKHLELRALEPYAGSSLTGETGSADEAFLLFFMSLTHWVSALNTVRNID